MSPFKLHIGSRVRADGWKNFDIIPGPDVDYLGDCRDLSQFRDGSIDTIYASHVLEHVSYQGMVQQALQEWFRVLAPGGTLMVSVPDFEGLARYFLEPQHTMEQRFHIMRIIFGGQIDEHDFHAVGFTLEFLTDYLAHAGFSDIRRVEGFGLFKDTSTLMLGGVAASLNVMARKPTGPRVAASGPKPVTSFLRKG